MPSPLAAKDANDTLSGKSPIEIIEWTVANGRRPLVTTSFGPFSAVMLHMATRVKPDIAIGWVDSGYNTASTYRYAENLIETLDLNLKIAIPRDTRARREALAGPPPALDTEEHKEFTHQVKLEPFERLLAEIKPDMWVTAVRKDETEYRATLEVLSAGPSGVTKVAPFLEWTEVDMEGYLYEHGLPQNEDYRDPTKGSEDRECGLHTLHETVYMGDGI